MAKTIYVEYEYHANRLSFKNGDSCPPFLIQREEFCLGFLLLGVVNHFRGVDILRMR